MPSYERIKKTKDKNGEVEFQAEIPSNVLADSMDEALERAMRNFALPGFRKGKVPEAVVRQHVPESELLEIAADELLHDAVKDIIEEQKLSILGSPQLTITKIAPKNPLEFKVRFAIAPTVTLPDYKEIGRKIMERKDDHEVNEKEIDEAVERIKKIFAAQTGKEESAPLPELTDDFAKQLGPFKTVDELRAELKKQLKQEKELGTKEVKREEIVKEIVKHSKITVPELLINQEWDAFMAERDAELKKAGLTLAEYLKQTKKDEKTLEKEERALIEEQIKTSLVFREIRAKENVKAEEKEIQSNIAYLKMRYPDRSEASLRQTAEAVIVQEKVFDILGASIK